MTHPDAEYEPILQEQPADDGFPPEELPTRRKSKRWIIILLIVFAVISLITYTLYSTMLGYTGYSRVKSYLSHARTIYKTARLWQEEGNPPLQSHIGQFGVEVPDDAFGEFLQQYGVSEQGSWYAIECDADGNVLCVWYSKSKITEDELWHIPWEMTHEDLTTPFQVKQAVVCYPQEDGTPIDEPIY